MNLEEFTSILDFMEKHRLVEFEFEENGKRIRLRKEEANHRTSAVLPPPPAAGGATVTPPPAAPEPSPNRIIFRSPMVGTFYRSPKPGAPPFAREGDDVTPDKVVCIIEAMKVMNEVKADFEGRVVEVLAKDGQAVEFGTPLFAIDRKTTPAAS